MPAFEIKICSFSNTVGTPEQLSHLVASWVATVPLSGNFLAHGRASADQASTMNCGDARAMAPCTGIPWKIFHGKLSHWGHPGKLT